MAGQALRKGDEEMNPLNLIDMTKKAQVLILGTHGHIPPDLQELWFKKGLPADVLLAALAFRLRDKAVKKYIQGWHTARQKVSHHLGCGIGSLWWMEEAQPIHWIAAALLALEKKQ